MWGLLLCLYVCSDSWCSNLRRDHVTRVCPGRLLTDGTILVGSDFTVVLSTILSPEEIVDIYG